MPTGFDISLKQHTCDRAHRIPPYLGLRQPLSGFDPEYRNIIDHIGSPAGSGKPGPVTWIMSKPAIPAIRWSLTIAACNKATPRSWPIPIHTTAAFSDIFLNAEEVIWAGNDQVGFHTSHPTRIIGTYTGPSKYRNATGRAVNVLAMPNCGALGNDIFPEHVLINTSAC